MSPFERIKGDLQLLLDARFSRENLAAVEKACTRFLENARVLDPSSARGDAGIYLHRELASDMCLASGAAHSKSWDRLLAALQKALAAILAFPRHFVNYILTFFYGESFSSRTRSWALSPGLSRAATRRS